MDNKKNNLPLIIGIVIVVACLAFAGIGIGGYLVYRNFSHTDIANIFPTATIEEDSPITVPDFEEPQPTATPWNPELPAPDPDLSGLFETLWTVRSLLHDNFLYQPVDDNLLASGAIDGLDQYLEAQNIDLQAVSLPDGAPSPEETASRANTPEDAFDAFLPFWNEWNKLAYLDTLPKEASQLTLMRHAITGMVQALDDPYTNYFDPDLAEQWNNDLSGEYEGIGAFVDVETEYLTIISPIEGAPAEAAGLLPGDQIIAIDGNDMTGVDPNIALTQVLGPAGTQVTLTILREGQDPFDVVITRERIVIPYIQTKMLDNGIAYLQLLRFYDGADADVRDALQELLDQNPVGLIFDLRGNPGGYLHTVVSITSEFVDNGVILYEEFSDGTRQEYPALRSAGLVKDIPLVVLVDQGSASASEIFAGAIKDYQRGTLVGQTTFGKGLVQMPIELPDNAGLISITIARWLTPNGETIHGVGVEPDVFVEFTQADAEAGLDPQLDAAINILTQGE